MLGFRVHADLLEALVLDDGILPVTIGVFGDWGSGKSSIMRMMEAKLNALEDDTLCLYFNGWVFEGYDDAKAALLDSILKAFTDERRFGPAVKAKVTQLFKSVNWMRVMGLGLKNVALPLILAHMGEPTSVLAAVSGALPAAAGVVNKIGGALGVGKKKKDDEAGADEEEKTDFSSLLQETPEEKTMLVREFRQNFEELLAETNITRLVVLIDDLDRCSPDRLIENLEAIKLFVNVPKTAFIIGADPRIVKHAIEYRYKSRITADEPTNADARTERISDQFVRDYLEKLIQIPYYLPRLSDSEVETYLSLLFCEKHLTTATHGRVLSEFERFRTANRYGAFGFADLSTLLTPEEAQQLKLNAPLVTSLAPVITEGLKGNPRQIKRFLNSFTLRTRLAGVAKFTSFRLDVLGKLMVLEYAEPGLFRKIYDWQAGQEGEPRELTELESLAGEGNIDEIKNKHGAHWTSERVVRWLKVEPLLAEVDLRDYFWISRDQLAGSISGASLIPPLIKTLFRELMEYGSETILRASASKATQLKDNEQTILLEMMVQEIAKRPANIKGHRVLIDLVITGMPDALAAYKRALANINHADIPYSLHNTLRLNEGKTPSLKELYGVYDPSSRIGKAIAGSKK
ncbi:KAP family P-loop NTPase fold protein [Hymenobacter sediminis]|uniref:KAP family P-loop NTPase fold protein n=1 Tax=Hymenobacter sediminis TaxID=2218621 RepID=UPI001EE4609F|nr:P-loop NTPase fold protein [Hymenobacter sediminis]